MFHVWMSIALLLALIGLVGSVLPVLPGTILSLAAMLLVEFGTGIDFNTSIWIVVGVLVAASIASDYIFPLLGAKRGGGTKYGTRGSIAGMVLGFAIPPRGLIIGPIIGAFVGEYIYMKDRRQAWKAARGSFLGSTASTVVKLIAAVIVVRYIVAAWV